LNPFIGSVALLPIEQLLNSLLQRDPHSLKKLAGHAGKVLQIDSTLPPATIRIAVQSGGIKLYAGAAEEFDLQIDARISAKSSDLTQLLFSANNNRPMANPEVSISGDVEFVQGVYGIASELEIDWESQLANIIGDVATAQLSRLFSQTLSWSRQSFKNSTGVVDEYLHEELGIVPTTAEIEQFGDNLDELKLSIDRLTARTRKIQHRIENLNNPATTRSESN